MDYLQRAFQRHNLIFLNRSENKLVISFFSPVSPYFIRKTYCPLCRGRGFVSGI